MTKLASVEAKPHAADVRSQANRSIGRGAHVDVADRNVDANVVDDRNANVPFRRAVLVTAADREPTGLDERSRAAGRPRLEGPRHRVARFDDDANVRDPGVERERVAGGKQACRWSGRGGGSRPARRGRVEGARRE